jgi:SAM-dependent methyltransferase
MNDAALDYGYPWWLTSGHLYLFALLVVLTAIAWRLKLPRWVLGTLVIVGLWAGVAAAAIAAVDINGVPALSTDGFLRGGTGRVLDLGAGTGRSSVMVLRARPKATLVASDLFGESFDEHFGQSGTPQDRLMTNLRAAGVDGRASVATADMTKLPFEAASFDAEVSAYAMDHLSREGSSRALVEAHRVLEPGGELLLILVNNDAWTMFLFGPMLSHGGLRSSAWWKDRAKEAGFTLVEEGTSPATRYFLLRRGT